MSIIHWYKFLYVQGSMTQGGIPSTTQIRTADSEIFSASKAGIYTITGTYNSTRGSTRLTPTTSYLAFYVNGHQEEQLTLDLTYGETIDIAFTVPLEVEENDTIQFKFWLDGSAHVSGSTALGTVRNTFTLHLYINNFENINEETLITADKLNEMNNILSISNNDVASGELIRKTNYNTIANAISLSIDDNSIMPTTSILSSLVNGINTRQINLG